MILDLVAPDTVTLVDNCRYGRMAVVTGDRYMGQAFIRYGEYSEAEVDLWRGLLAPHAIVADVGANIGAHTVALAKLAHRGGVYAFEPLKFMHSLCVTNVTLNGLANVEVIRAAVGEAPGTLKVPPIDYTQQNNYGGLALGKYDQGTTVPIVRLDDILPRVDFIKADVEGMEMGVLKGASRLIRDHRPTLYVEANPEEGHPDGEGPMQLALIAHMQAAGYHVYWHLPPLYNPDNHRGATPLDDHEANVVSHNLLALPAERGGLPDTPPIAPVSIPPGGVANSQGSDT